MQLPGDGQDRERLKVGPFHFLYVVDMQGRRCRVEMSQVTGSRLALIAAEMLLSCGKIIFTDDLLYEEHFTIEHGLRIQYSGVFQE